jgi:hypothetical protein
MGSGSNKFCLAKLVRRAHMGHPPSGSSYTRAQEGGEERMPLWADGHPGQVTRQLLIGKSGNPTALRLRYERLSSQALMQHRAKRERK